MQEFLKAYTDRISETIAGIDPAEFQKAVGILTEAHQNDRQVFIAGHGGSAGTANHFSCDFGKNAVQTPGVRRFRIQSLSSNVEKITAFGNDIAFDEIFSQQMENLFNPGDVLILVSASGKSPDLIRACEHAKRKGSPIIGLTGFEGGSVRDYADANLIVPLESYEMIEDIHSMILHLFVYYFKTHPQALTA